MNYYYDTEFIENGPNMPIKLLSIGIVKQNGNIYYAETPASMNTGGARDWVVKNVYSQFTHFNHKCECKNLDLITGRGRDPNCPVRTMGEIKYEIGCFISGDQKPQLVGYFPAYDHVVLCQVFGTMDQKPEYMPYSTFDINQYKFHLGVHTKDIPKMKDKDKHNALADAKWTKTVWEYLEGVDNKRRLECEQAKAEVARMETESLFEESW